MSHESVTKAKARAAYETRAESELFCTDFDVPEMRKFPCRSISERELSVRFVRKSCLSIRATRSRRVTPGKRRMIGQEENTMHNISRIRSIVFALVVLAMSAAAFAQIGISISFAPPELPVYEQPLCPAPGYLWTPGYWAYGDDFDDYYWVPGTWVMAPEPGLLWTPAYWGWSNGGYVFNEGYWGPQVGFYGGISYGFGYTGEGYQGGRWQNGQFFYNSSVNNVSVTDIHNVYNTTVVNTTTVRVSYNGGTGGISARPTAQDEVAARATHIPPVAAQTQHAQAAHTNPQQRASVNQGKPAVAATPKPGAFTDKAVVPAKAAGAPYKAPAKSAAAKPAANAPAAHPAEPQRATPAPAETKRAAPEPQHAQPAARPAEPQRATPPPAPAETKRAAPEPQRAEPAARAPAEKKQPEEKKPPEEKPKE
jgi:hypothetical protein